MSLPPFLKTLPPLLTLATTPSLGRHLLLNSPHSIPSQTVLLTSLPLASHSDSPSPNRCQHCYREQCDGGCVSLSPSHRSYITAVNQLSLHPPSLPPGRHSGVVFKTALRVLLEGGDDETMRNLAGLCKPKPPAKTPREWKEKYEMTREAFRATFGLPADKVRWFDYGFYEAVYLRLAVNSFGTPLSGNPSDSSTVTSLHALPSMFNHSCSPTVSLSNAGAVLTFVAAADLLPNAHLTISYLPSTVIAHAERREYLLENYGFNCQCEKCKEGGSGYVKRNRRRR